MFVSLQASVTKQNEEKRKQKEQDLNKNPFIVIMHRRECACDCIHLIVCLCLCIFLHMFECILQLVLRVIRVSVSVYWHNVCGIVTRGGNTEQQNKKKKKAREGVSCDRLTQICYLYMLATPMTPTITALSLKLLPVLLLWRLPGLYCQSTRTVERKRRSSISIMVKIKFTIDGYK